MENKKNPMRQCVGSREMKAKREMVRVIKTVSDDGTETNITLDTTGRKNGRGAYICPNLMCFNAAVKNKGLERSFKMPIPKEVYELLKKEMEELETG